MTARPWRPRRLPLDTVGTTVSVACAVHCLGLPLVVGLLPAFGLARMLDERVEWALLATTAVVAAASLGPAAWRTRAHAGWWTGPLCFATGFGLLVGMRLTEGQLDARLGATGVVLGAAGVATAHLLNHRRGRRWAVACAAPCCAAADGRPLSRGHVPVAGVSAAVIDRDDGSGGARA